MNYVAADDPERALALSYAAADRRLRLAALLNLDQRLATIVRAAREPIVGQMRLTWWFEALSRLDHAPPPAEPVLQSLAEHVLPHGVSGATLAGMIDGWEELLDIGTLGDEAMARYAAARGGVLFVAGGRLLGAAATDPLDFAGRGWALADLARHLHAPSVATRATILALPLITAATAVPWSRAARPLGALAHVARLNLAVPQGRPLPIGSPRRVGRLLLHRLTGR